MAIEEIALINTNGEEITVSNLVNQMINYYELKQEVGETKITDFAEGSEIRNLLEAFAICIYALMDEQSEATKITFIDSSYGVWLDKIGELPFINLPRITGNPSEGVVTFTLSETQSTNTIIAEETLLTCSESDAQFITTEECIILAGDSSANVTAEAINEGEDGNVGIGEIDGMVSDSLNLELLSVTNNIAFEQGTDEEDDDDYRERLLANIRSDGFGTLGYYITLCESVDGVHDVVFTDATGYTKKIVINGDNKPVDDSTLLEVLLKVTDVANIVLGHKFTIDVPEYSTVTLDISLNVSSLLSDTEILSLINSYFDGGDSIDQEGYEGLKINESVTREQLIQVLGVYDEIVEVTSMTSDDAEFIIATPDPNGVLVFDVEGSTISQNVVE